MNPVNIIYRESCPLYAQQGTNRGFSVAISEP